MDCAEGRGYAGVAGSISSDQIKRTATLLWLLRRMCLCPLSLGLRDEALLVLPCLLLVGLRIARFYRSVVGEAVEDAEAQSGPAEDLLSISSASIPDRQA